MTNISYKNNKMFNKYLVVYAENPGTSGSNTYFLNEIVEWEDITEDNIRKFEEDHDDNYVVNILKLSR